MNTPFVTRPAIHATTAEKNGNNNHFILCTGRLSSPHSVDPKSHHAPGCIACIMTHLLHAGFARADLIQ